MNLTCFSYLLPLLLLLLLCDTGEVDAIGGGKIKLLAVKGPHGGFLGIKVRKPKFLKHGGLSLGHAGLGGYGGGFHSSGYEHHEYHHSHHSEGGFGGWGGWGGWGK